MTDEKPFFCLLSPYESKLITQIDFISDASTGIYFLKCVLSFIVTDERSFAEGCDVLLCLDPVCVMRLKVGH